MIVLWQLGLQAVTHYGHKNIKAWHSNMPLPEARPSPVKNPLIFLSTVLSAFSQEGRANMQRAQQFAQQGTGYSKMQSTKPQTLAYGLTDSPVGLLAWIYEKLVIWSDKYPWGDDEGEDIAGFLYRDAYGWMQSLSGCRSTGSQGQALELQAESTTRWPMEARAMPSMEMCGSRYRWAYRTSRVKLFVCRDRESSSRSWRRNGFR